jgi:prolyl oligopeptidase
MHRSPPAIAAMLVAALAAASLAGPPPTKVETVTDVVHGQPIADDYRWLEALEEGSEEVRAWTTAQNDYTRAVLERWPGRAKLEARLGQLMTIGSVTAPSMRENRYFYTERTGEQNQAVLYLREGADGAPRVLLDPNALDDRGLVSLDWFVPSDDGRVLAFGLSRAGDEMSVLHLMDVDTGAWRADEIPGKVEFGGWAPGGGAFLYGQLEDPADAYSRVYRWHEVGRHHRADPVLLEQEKPSRIPGATLSRDGRWIIVQQFEGWSKQDVYAADVAAWRRTGTFTQVPIAEGIDARFEPQFIRGDDMFMLTTYEAPNGRLVAVSLLEPAREKWRPILAEDAKAVLASCAEMRDGFVAEYERDATTRLMAFGLGGSPRGPVELPGLGSASIATSYDRTEAFVSYASYNEPDTIYRVDLSTRDRAIWARPEVPIDPSMVTVKQEWCTSRDGTRVPMFVVHRTDLVKDGRTPTVIYAYGGFNISMRPAFIATNFPWYEGGGIYVVANLRGGGEYGESWHRAGMLESKQNVYDDLYAVAEHLIESGVTTREHLAVMGGSNGGLLTGVAATQRPDLWAAVVSAVPLLDMVRFPDFLMAKFWTPEYGDPADAVQFKWLRAYSPYHNVAKGKKYPAILFTAGENDNRVHPMHARKMAALLQAQAANDQEKHPILLWVEREAGHGRGKPLHLRIQDYADRWSFIIWQTGMNGG